MQPAHLRIKTYERKNAVMTYAMICSDNGLFAGSVKSHYSNAGFTLSVRLSVRLSVCGQNRVCSVFSTILVGSISYLHILSI